jgi:hypothetical protein
MYVDSIRNTIKAFNEEEYQEYLKRLRSILIRKYNKNIRPSVLRQRVDEFVQGKDPNIDSFEAYLTTFDELAVNGAINALFSQNIKMPKTWRQILLTVTEDRTFSPDVVKHLNDQEILIEIKALFYNCVEHCKHEDRDQFFNNLYHFNGFLKIGAKNRKPV